MSSRLIALSEVCEIIMGQAPVGSSYNDKGEGLPLIAGAGDFGELSPIPKKFTTAPSKISKCEDLILCIRATIGDLNWSDKEYCLGRGVAGLRPIVEMLDRNYLWHFISSNKHELASKGTGSTFKQVSRSHIAEWEIPLPPLEEQKRIAAILDKADAIRRKRQQAIQLADDFLRAVFLDMFGDPVTNLNNYKKVTLKEVCTIRGGKRIPKGKSLVKDDTGFPYIKAGNIKNGKVNCKNLEYVTPEVRKVIDRYRVDKGDVCITVVGANIGDVGIVPDELHNASLTENANKILINEDTLLINVYLAFALRMDFIQNQIRAKTMAVGVPKLALFRIEELEILLPPRKEQIEFARLVQKFEVYSDKLESGTPLSGEFFASLSQKAFAGEL